MVGRITYIAPILSEAMILSLIHTNCTKPYRIQKKDFRFLPGCYMWLSLKLNMNAIAPLYCIICCCKHAHSFLWRVTHVNSKDVEAPPQVEFFYLNYL